MRWARAAVVALALLVAAGAGVSRRAGSRTVHSAVAVATYRPIASLLAKRSPPKRPDRKGSIAGVVRDTRDAPIAGALVCAQPPRDPSLAPADDPDDGAACATSGRGGAYVIEDLAAGTYDLRVSARAHYLPADAALTITLDPGEAATGADFVLAAGAVEVLGDVADERGEPVPGATIVASVSTDEGDVETSTRSDARGRFSLWLPPGDVSAAASAEGYASAFAEGHAPGGSIHLSLMPESTIAGRAVDAAGAPVEGVIVDADELTEGLATPRWSRTDASGRFLVRGLEPGRYELNAKKKGWAGKSAGSFLLGVGDTADGVVIVMHQVPTARLEGRVRVDGTGAPCPFAEVTLSSDADVAEASADDQGAVSFPDLAPGLYAVGVTCEGWASLDAYPPIEIADGAHQLHEWTVHAGASIAGVVLNGDVRVDRGSVTAELETEDSDEETYASTSIRPDGSFELAGLEPGRYLLTPALAGFVEAGEPVLVEVAERGAVTGVRLHLRAGAIIEGRVRDTQGAAVAGAEVEASCGDDGTFASSRTDDAGRFTIDGLTAGTCYLGVGAPDGSDSLRTAGNGLSDVQGVQVDGSGTTTVEITVEPANGRIEGVVLDDDGGPVAGAYVVAIREDDERLTSGDVYLRGRAGSTPRRHLTDGAGRFAVDRLPEGLYTLRAFRRGGADVQLEHVALGRSVILALDRGGVIGGEVLDPQGHPSESFTINVVGMRGDTHRTETFQGGRWRVDGLPSDAYDVVASTPGEAAIAYVELAKGTDRTDVALRLTPRSAPIEPESAPP